jgi:TPR repeat protein
MIDAKEYFERHIAVKKNINGTSANDSYASMDMDSLRREADYAIPGALEELGERYLFGISVGKDVDKACEMFTKAAQAGNPDAMYMLADVYRTEQYGRQDWERYFELLPAAAERGSWKAMFNLALAYYKGKKAHGGFGPEADHSQTIVWSTRCMNMCQALLTMFFAGSSTKELESYFSDVYDTFVRCVSATSKQYADGDGTEKDIEKARAMVNKGQELHQKWFQCDCPQFSAILKKLENA